MTTQAAKDLANNLAAELTTELKSIGGLEAKVDDWGRYNNFSIIVSLNVQASHTRTGAWRPVDDKTFDIRKIYTTIKRVVGKYTKFGDVSDRLQRLYTTVTLPGTGAKPDKHFDGYDKYTLHVDATFPNV